MYLRTGRHRSRAGASLELIAKSQNDIDRAIPNRLIKIKSCKKNLENCNNMRE